MPGTFENILLIDDSPINLEFLSMYFESNKVEVSKAESTADARKILSQKQFDLTLLDYLIPAEDGVSFLKSMEANNHLGKLGKVIIVTADTEFDPEKLNIKNSISGYINKPLDLKDLEDILETVR